MKGSIDAKGARTETDLIGKKVRIQAGSLSMSSVTQSGTLDLSRRTGRWVVTGK